MIFVKVAQFFRRYISIISSTFLKKEGIVRIASINDIKKEIIIRMRGVISPIRLGFDEIIKDGDILSGFSPMQASYVGYYYGLNYYNSINKSNYPNIHFDYFQNIPTSKFTIYMIDRHRNIIYVDQINETQYSKAPLQIMFDKSLITKFPPLQSCYIGILSGITKAKINNQIAWVQTNEPELKLV